MLNKLSAAKTTNIDHVDCDGLAGTRISACLPATRRNGIFRLDRSLQREFQVLNAPPRVFDLGLLECPDREGPSSPDTHVPAVAPRKTRLRLTNLRERSRAQLWI